MKRFISLLIAITVCTMFLSSMTIVEASANSTESQTQTGKTSEEVSNVQDELDSETIEEEIDISQNEAETSEDNSQSLENESTVSNEENSAENEAESSEDEEEPVYYNLPARVQREVDRQIKKFRGIKIGVGIYSLDGKKGYEYNADTLIPGGCTVKAGFALFVLKKCEELGIDIYTETITHTKSNTHGGSGVIQYSKYGTKYTIYELLDKMLGISDNAAYYMLASKFSLKDYQDFIVPLGGQKLAKGQYFGSASVHNRKNEWVEIYKYISSGSTYSDVLKELISNTKYCYITYQTESETEYLHKSGWSYGSYSCACDCAIINDNYLVIIMTSVPNSEDSYTSPVIFIGKAVIDKFAVDMGGEIF